ncbi:hypothetical protein EVAR_89055_1 [Eumeta japonica]|uniref:Uncharacterized protein n=1 Tax=Eumeta variegata TaxID=151549 RepID=A0A4C1XM27_EUMVA|nr:hypothetical protein EVAR_89055_1 [Eumeta japonica]
MSITVGGDSRRGMLSSVAHQSGGVLEGAAYDVRRLLGRNSIPNGGEWAGRERRDLMGESRPSELLLSGGKRQKRPYACTLWECNTSCTDPLSCYSTYILLDRELNNESAPESGRWSYIDFHSCVRLWTSKGYVGLTGDERHSCDEWRDSFLDLFTSSELRLFLPSADCFAHGDVDVAAQHVGL